MLSKIRQSNQKGFTRLSSRKAGFTIIEVLIVLAIAGLILLVVFLAVPALQRNSRNQQRHSDISGLIGAINEYVNNNGGAAPTGTCDNTTPCAFLTNAKFGFYKLATTDPAANFTYTNNAVATAVANPANIDHIAVGTYSTCNTTGTASTATGATARSIAVVYDVETGAGTTAGTPVCKTAQ